MPTFRAAMTELEAALQSGSPGQRTNVLLRVTGFLARETERLSEHQISMFDDVFGYLVTEMEQEALVELSKRLAQVEKAPPRIIKILGHHDTIEIAGPILAHSPRFTDEDLIEIARTKGQAHQLSIAARPQLAEAVTEVLIDRGDSEVVHTVASNKGASFSHSGFSKLAALAVGNDRLASAVASRSDVPPRIFRDILARASEMVRQKLLAAAAPERRETLKRILTEISGKIGAGATARHYAKAQHLVRSFSQDTLLTKQKLLVFARARHLDETVATLATLTAVPIELVDRLFYETDVHGLLMLCKLMALDWDIAQEVLLARPNDQESAPQDLKALEEDYRTIAPQMAQRVIRFWESRQHAAMAPPVHRQTVVLPL